MLRVGFLGLASLRLNPQYDFGIRQREHYVDTYPDMSAVPKKNRKVMEMFSKAVNLKADITMVHGKKIITTNKTSFDEMTQKYAGWVKKMATLTIQTK